MKWLGVSESSNKPLKHRLLVEELQPLDYHPTNIRQHRSFGASSVIPETRGATVATSTAIWPTNVIQPATRSVIRLVPMMILTGGTPLGHVHRNVEPGLVKATYRTIQWHQRLEEITTLLNGNAKLRNV